MLKLALFDFCGTLVSFQTADAFVDYVRERDGNLYMRYLNIMLDVFTKIGVITVLNKIFPGAAFSKKFKLLQMRGISYEKLNNLAESYYKEKIKPRLIAPIITEMLNHAQKNYEICLVSAGYSIYLKYFAEDHHIKHIISTEIAFDQDKNCCLGTISGMDCFHTEKVNRLKIYFAGQNINYNESISYSDSITDMPMLLMTGKGVVVSLANSQPWSNKSKFKEIIWK